MFISKPYGGRVYFAERSQRSQGRANGLRWSIFAISEQSEMRVDAGDVPRHIRYRAYKMFERDRNG
jgi:hypothetical protein